MQMAGAFHTRVAAVSVATPVRMKTGDTNLGCLCSCVGSQEGWVSVPRLTCGPSLVAEMLPLPLGASRAQSSLHLIFREPQISQGSHSPSLVWGGADWTSRNKYLPAQLSFCAPQGHPQHP